MISCAEAVKQLWDYLDRELSPTDRKLVEEHLAFCRKCCGESEFAEELQRFLAEQRREEDIPAEVRARLEAILVDIGEG
jgi:mycothiol system anti-sigma-R factor